VKCFAKVRRLAILVGDLSKVLVDLGMPPISWIQWDPRAADVVLDVAGTILEGLQKAYASSRSPWD
jgi:hypothetical protein